MMFNKFICALVLTIIVVTNGSETPADVSKDVNENRIYFSTFTVILSTVTSTTTVATTTFCTTSTAALKTCSVGRRRRGLFYDDAENKGRARRGLFYNDDDDESDYILLPVKRSADQSEGSISTSQVTVNEKTWVPLTVESGFTLPEGYPIGAARFKLAYGTSTTTSTTTSTFTSSLTATCASTTGFNTCSSATGK